MKITEFQVQKDDLSKSRLATREAGALEDGDILVRVERFALTANNITYGVVGEKIGYWKFFPAPEGWGVIPVWGFAEVVETKHPDVQTGERLYGYFPMGTHLVMRPDRLRAERLVDSAAHRAALPPVYNSYARVAGEPGYDAAMDDERILLFPLYATSFCLYDFLLDNEWFGAEQVVIVSASSKTAIGLAYALHDDKTAPRLAGVTSKRNVATVTKLGLYDEIVAYEELTQLDAGKPAVIVDMSGNGTVLSDLHRRLGGNMKYCSNVGVTHWDDNAVGPDFIRERSAMFFAPRHIQKRGGDWGPGAFEKRALAFWKDAAMRSRSWLEIDRHAGVEAVEAIFHKLRNGDLSPDKGVVVSL